MKVSEPWLRTFVNPDLSSAALGDVLLKAGIELEQEIASDHRVVTDAAGAQTMSEPQLDAAAMQPGSFLNLKIPANRGDCLSVLGLAREIAALVPTPLLVGDDCMNPAHSIQATHTQSAVLRPGVACTHYVTAVLSQVDNRRATPAWMVERLAAAGIDTISVVVDVLNYVMLELGQPLHAFDQRFLKGSLVLRQAEPGESLTLLNGRKLSLVPDDLVVADAAGVQALAGIMGAEQAAIKAETQTLVLESACFDPIPIRLSAQRYNLRTEAAYRFERGVDPQMVEPAMKRAIALLREMTGACSGLLTVITQDVQEIRPAPKPIDLHAAHIQRVLGIALPPDQIKNILERLNMRVSVTQTSSTAFSETPASGMEIPRTEALYEVLPPSYRMDLKRPIDLIEELARVYGLDRLPVACLSGVLRPSPVSERVISDTELKNIFTDRGYHEIISYSFIDPIWTEHLGVGPQPWILKNPISSEMALMRFSLWPGLLKVLAYNQNRQQKRLRLFEMGRCFGEVEHSLIAGLICGSVYPEQWGLKNHKADFYDLKNEIEVLLQGRLHQNLCFEPMDHPALTAGEALAVCIKNHGQGQNQEPVQRIGCLGTLDSRLVKKLDLEGPIVVFELDRRALFPAHIPSFQSFSKFPSVRRDIAVWVDRGCAVADLIHSVQASAGEYLQKVFVFDVYQPKDPNKTQKSVALSFTLQHPTRTLTDQEVQSIWEQVLHRLQTQHQAVLRE